MKTPPVSRKCLAAGLLVLLLAIPFPVLAAPPDLTAPGAIAALKTDTTASPLYSLTYNLGPTGLRGWINLSRGWGTTFGQDGTMTGESRQILVTVASAPANVELQVDDVILGVDWGSGTGAIPFFTSDARKAFGAAITEAEKSENGGILRIKRWRAGVTTDVSFILPVMGSYTATAPYNCPKSDLIRTNARNKLVSQLLANPNFLTSDWKGAVSGLALLAGVAPADPDDTMVQTRLQTYARALSTAGPVDSGLPIWDWGYLGIFLAEYYLATGDANVLPGINQYSLKLAQSQSMFGTFGHGPAIIRPDGTGRMSVAGYGPVNAAGLPANLALVMGRKALLAGAQTVDPQVDAAIQRASNFFSWYVNKGSIPYGEHHPGADDHGSNGKDQAAALFFSQQDNRLAETEYFTRMCVAGFTGREYGHTGQGFSYLWEGMATHVGGQLAVAEYFKPVRWHLDLSRRTDGSFAYDGGEQYDAGSTSDGTYLGSSGYNGLNPTACYLLTYSLPLKRLYITGKNANPAQELDSTKVANAIAAATYKFDRTSRTTTQLIGDLSEFDPVVRNYAAKELAARTLTSTELTTLRTMLSGPDANGRMGACQTLGLHNPKDTTALPMITQRLDKTVEQDPWVRAIAANALRDYGTAANSQVNTMLTRFVDNAADPDTIVWSDPLQASNGKLSWALFDSAPGTSDFDFGTTAINAAKNLLYPAVSAGFKQPDSAVRQSPANFAFNRMPIGDVQAMPNDFINLILSETQCDRMWSGSGPKMGIRLLSKYKFFETMPLGLSLLDVPTGFEWGYADYVDQAISEIATYGEAARWTLPTLRSYLNTWDPGSSTQTALVNAINSIEAATTAPTITYLKATANGQVVTTAAGTAKAITLTGSSSRQPSVSFDVLTQPSNGTLTGTAPNLIYTPNPGYTGPDHFTFRTADTLTTSEPATVGIVVGTAGMGLKGEYFDNANFTNPVLTRTDAQVNFDWGTGSPHASINADTFSVRWSGLLLVPETCAYTFSALSNDGVRLYINGVPAIDNFVDQNSKWKDSAPIQLTKGQMVEIQMEYYENTGSAAAKLKWTGPSVAGITGSIIPQTYLFDGTGMTRTPYAFTQSLTMLKNHSQAVTLAGSIGTQSYSVVTPPAHGTLTGTAPNLTYTPFTNYIGLDSFTFKVNNGTSDSAPATVSIDVIPANTFSVNFYANGALTTPEAQANLKLNTSVSAGLADWFTYGWTNIEVPWGLSSPQAPATLTSNRGNTAAFVFKSCRNGGPYNWSTPRTTLLGDGNGNMMDGHVNSTLDGPYLFDMEVTGIPFAVYDVIFYIGANKDQFGTGTGVIKLNGGADRAFTLKPGAFDGTFTEMVNATTQGNYIVFSGVTGPSFTTQTWGTGPTGFNHIGPCGFQIREAVVGGDTTTTLVSSPGGTASYGDAVTFTATVGASGVPATGTVTFRDGSAVLGTGVLSGGTASFTTSTLTVANHSITATYDGNGTFSGSFSSPMTYVVTPKALTITGVTAGNKIYDGNASAALTGGAVSGVIGGETVTIIPGSGTFASPNVGTWAVTASGYALSGANAANYLLASQPTVPNASITPRPVQLTGTRTYDGTVAATWWGIANNIDDTNLTVTGSANLTAKDVGSQGILSGFATPARLGNAATGSTGSSAATSFTVTVAAPTSGNTLIAVITTRVNSADRVSGIFQTGVTWAKAPGAEGINTSSSSGTTTEIWVGSIFTTGAATTLTITLASSYYSAAVVAEYSGLLATGPLDKTTGASGNTNSASTGTTAATTQATELWIGGIGLRDSTYTLGTPANAFTPVTSANSTNTTTNSNAKAFFLEKIVAATGTAGTSGTITSSRWSGAIATFKAAPNHTLALTGSAAGNYTLTGLTGSVEITPKALTLTATPAVTTKPYDSLTAATLTGVTLRTAEAPGTGTTSDGIPYSGDAVTVVLSGTFTTKDAGSGKAVTSTSTLSGANAGNYSLTQPTGLTGSIAPKALTLTATPTVTTKIYDGLTSATLTGASLRVAEAPETGTPSDGTPYTGDEVAVVLSGLFETKDANSDKAVTSTSSLSGAQKDNYTLTQPVGVTGTISTAGLTIAADDQAKTFGQTLEFGSGATQFTSIGLQDDETIGSVTLVCDGGGPEAGVGSYPITPGTATGGSFSADNYTVSYLVGTLTVDPGVATTFEAWAVAPAQGLTAGENDGPLNDPDFDGFSNLLEFVLGGEPMVSSQAIRPKLTQTGGAWVFSYQRSHLSKPTTTQVVEHGDDLTGWTPLTIPEESAGAVTITPGAFSDLVEVIIPAPGDNSFVRLKVSR